MGWVLVLFWLAAPVGAYEGGRPRLPGVDRGCDNAPKTNGARPTAGAPREGSHTAVRDARRSAPRSGAWEERAARVGDARLPSSSL